MKSHLNHHLCHALWLTCATFPIVGCATAAKSQIEVAQEKKLVVGRQEFDGKVIRVEENRLELQLPDPQEQRMITLNPELLAKLRLVPDLSYKVLAHQRQTGGGISAAVRLKDERGLYAITESIQDMPLFKSEEREGIKVEQMPGQNRTLVYEDNCKIVYNVPTEFTIGDQRLVLQAYETQTIQIGQASYTLSLSSSQFVVLKQCAIPFEGGQSQVDYSIVRNQ